MFMQHRGGRGPYNRAPFNQSYLRNQRAGRSSNQLSELARQGAGGLTKTLGNIQQVLHLVESAAPVIEQYGPMIKNLPSLYKIMKIMNEPEEEKRIGKTENVQSSKEEKNQADINYQASRPRLYI